MCFQFSMEAWTMCSKFVVYVLDFAQKTTLLRNEHEAQLRALQCEHEDECRRLQEELDVQKSKVCVTRFLT